jgi:hypothetical protein
MIDVPIVKDDCCAGCICQRCGKSAFEVGRSMNDMGWCDTCEALLHKRRDAESLDRSASTLETRSMVERTIRGVRRG